MLKEEVASLATAFDSILDYSQVESGTFQVSLLHHRLRDVIVN